MVFVATRHRRSIHWRWQYNSKRRTQTDIVGRLPFRTGPGFFRGMVNQRMLRRFLLSRVGRPWDEVVSECRGQLRSGSRKQALVLDELLSWTAKHTATLECGRVVIPLLPVWAPRELFYVCPESGRLAYRDHVRQARDCLAEARETDVKRVVTRRPKCHRRPKHGRLPSRR